MPDSKVLVKNHLVGESLGLGEKSTTTVLLSGYSMTPSSKYFYLLKKSYILAVSSSSYILVYMSIYGTCKFCLCMLACLCECLPMVFVCLVECACK